MIVKKNIIKSIILSKVNKTYFKHVITSRLISTTLHIMHILLNKIAKIFKLLACTVKSLGNLVDISNDFLN